MDALTIRGATVATAESCTGGALAHRLTNVPGASRVFLSGYVTYANAAKMRDLAVDARLIDAHGAVSEQVACAMADGARIRAGTDFALSTTGIAGPDGGTAAKPVGSVFIGLSAAGAPVRAQKHHFPRERETFKEFTVQAALETLHRALRDG